MSVFQRLSKNQHTNMEAFTIIEVVLVLAIAGLIFLMVFIALPALQRSQRDAQRKNDMTALLDA
jgi:type II secretory pathway pseudopilin PulG